MTLLHVFIFTVGFWVGVSACGLDREMDSPVLAILLGVVGLFATVVSIGAVIWYGVRGIL